MLCTAALAAILSLWASSALAQSNTPPPQGTSRGENFSAKPAPALFASDCTGSGCHRGPQGLAKNQSQFGLANFLREHYTNSRQSAAALAEYLMRSPGAPAEARTPRTAPGAQSSRAAARPEEVTPGSSATIPVPTPAAPPRRTAEPDDAAPKPAPSARNQRGRHTTAATPAAPPPEPAPPPAPPPPQQFDIFD
jgi:hypothetical protein